MINFGDFLLLIFILFVCNRSETISTGPLYRLRVALKIKIKFQEVKLK